MESGKNSGEIAFRAPKKTKKSKNQTDKNKPSSAVSKGKSGVKEWLCVDWTLRIFKALFVYIFFIIVVAFIFTANVILKLCTE